MTWPVYPNGSTGNGRQTFRSTAGGTVVPDHGAGHLPVAMFFVQPQTYVAQVSNPDFS